MKKTIYKLGITALTLLLPAVPAMAGNGDGDGKKTEVTLRSARNYGTVELFVRTTTPVIDISSVSVRGSGETELLPISITQNGDLIRIVLEAEHGGSGNPVDDGTRTDFIDIMEIVGIDNITGVFVGDDTPTHIDATFRAITDTDDINTGESNNNGNTSGNGTTRASGFDNTAPAGNGSTTPNDKAGANVINNGPSKNPTAPSIDIYPNPAVDETNVVTVGEILGKIVEVIDLSGKPHKSFNVSDGSPITRIDISDLKAGIYMVVVKDANGKTYVKRLSKVSR